MRQLPKYRHHNEFELFKSGCASSYDSAKIFWQLSHRSKNV